MIRTLITPTKQNTVIHLPKNYIGKKVEVIIFTTDEVNDEDAFEKKIKNGHSLEQSRQAVLKHIDTLKWDK